MALDRKSDKTGIEIDKEGLPGIYAHIKEYADDFNDEALTSMLGALKKYDFPGEEQQIFDQIVSSFEKADWVTIQNLLAQALENNKA